MGNKVNEESNTRSQKPTQKPAVAATARARGTSSDSPVHTSAEITLSRWSPGHAKLPTRRACVYVCDSGCVRSCFALLTLPLIFRSLWLLGTRKVFEDSEKGTMAYCLDLGRNSQRVERKDVDMFLLKSIRCLVTWGRSRYA